MNTSSRHVVSDKKNMIEERCTKCRGLLFMADAEGVIEIKCRKCGFLVRQKLKRKT